MLVLSPLRRPYRRWPRRESLCHSGSIAPLPSLLLAPSVCPPSAQAVVEVEVVVFASVTSDHPEPSVFSFSFFLSSISCTFLFKARFSSWSWRNISFSNSLSSSSWTNPTPGAGPSVGWWSIGVSGVTPAVLKPLSRPGSETLASLLHSHQPPALATDGLENSPLSFLCHPVPQVPHPFQHPTALASLQASPPGGAAHSAPAWTKKDLPELVAKILTFPLTPWR